MQTPNPPLSSPAPLVLKAGPVFLKNYSSKKRFTINRGGTSSTKTYSILTVALNWLITGRVDDDTHFERGTFTVARKYVANLKKSVQKDFEEILQSYELLDTVVTVNKSDRSYCYGKRKVEFIGVDDPQKARWPRRDILYCNEANELDEEDFFQLQIRTKYKIFLDFNPDDEDVWINRKWEHERANEEWDVEVIVSTYKDNPFLDPLIVHEIERMKEKDPEYFRIYGKGEYGKLEGLVFSFSDIPEVPEGARLLGHGQDFGYTNDPSACVSLYQWNGDIVLDEVFCRTWMANADIASAYAEAGFSRSDEIYADSAEPKSIDDLVARGWNVKPVKKGPDSIKFWIDCMKAQKIYVTARSANLRKEMKKYVWAKAKDGTCLNVPVWGQDHCIDGARYVSMSKLKTAWFRLVI